jgi:hypothetical protein
LRVGCKQKTVARRCNTLSVHPVAAKEFEGV